MIAATQARIIVSRERGTERVVMVGEDNAEIRLGRRAQELLIQLIENMPTTALNEPECIQRLRASGFRFGTVDDLSWKPEDRNHI